MTAHASPEESARPESPPNYQIRAKSAATTTAIQSAAGKPNRHRSSPQPILQERGVQRGLRGQRFGGLRATGSAQSAFGGRRGLRPWRPTASPSPPWPQRGWAAPARLTQGPACLAAAYALLISTSAHADVDCPSLTRLPTSPHPTPSPRFPCATLTHSVLPFRVSTPPPALPPPR